MNRRVLVMAPLLMAAFLGTAAATRPQGQSSAPAKAETKTTGRLTADQAYKANCTRCHSELPKVNARATKTILMHMRVRANMPADEAREILSYLTR